MKPFKRFPGLAARTDRGEPMKNIEKLQKLHFQTRLGGAGWEDCVNWAIERLRNDDEGDDLDIVMLAAATQEDEVSPLVVRIVERYIAPGALNDELAAGKLVVELFAAYKAKKESISSLEPKFWRLYYDLGQPSWLVMLARNCEYATDTDEFNKPFEDEFSYIAGLWNSARSLAEFLAMYDREISRSHDAI
jgi:hypothetical protein